MRPLGFCRNLPAFGWQPKVLTTTPECVYPVHQVDQKLGGRVPETVQVIRVPYIDRLQQVLQYREVLRGILKGNANQGRARKDLKNEASASSPQPGTGRSTVKDFSWIGHSHFLTGNIPGSRRS